MAVPSDKSAGPSAGLDESAAVEPRGSDQLGLPALLAGQVELRPEQPAVRYKRRGVYRSLSWRELEQRTAALAGGLSALGFAPGSILFVAAELSPEWLWGVLAAQRLGGTALCVDRRASDAEWQAALRHTPIRFALVQAAGDVDRLQAGRQLLGDEPVVIQVEPRRLDHGALIVRSLSGVEAAGAEQRDELGGAARSAAAGLAPAFIQFTPRGDEGSERRAFHHGWLARQARALHLDLSAGDELWLDPKLGHGADFFAALTGWLTAGARLGLAEAEDTQENDRRELGPSHVVARPQLFQQLAEAARARLPREGTLLHRLVRWALGTSSSGSRLEQLLARLLVLDPLLDRIGFTRVRAARVAGEGADDATRDFFAALARPLAPLQGARTQHAIVLNHAPQPEEAPRPAALSFPEREGA